MNIKEAQKILVEASGIRTFKVNGYTFRVYDDCVELRTPVALHIARDIYMNCKGIQFGDQHSYDPDQVATSLEFEHACAEMKNELRKIDKDISDEFLKQEENGLRKRMIKYYDEKKVLNIFQVSKVTIFCEDHLEYIVNILR